MTFPGSSRFWMAQAVNSSSPSLYREALLGIFEDGPLGHAVGRPDTVKIDLGPVHAEHRALPFNGGPALPRATGRCREGRGH